LKKLTSVNLVDKPATDLKYNFYSIQNPKDYLGGSDAVVVETGPYNLRCVVVLLMIIPTSLSPLPNHSFCIESTPLHTM